MFSLIFNKQFYAFSRKSNGKVRNICEVIKLKERFFENDQFKELEKIDYIKVNKEIEKRK